MVHVATMMETGLDFGPLLAAQRAFFDAGHTLPREFRDAQLRALLAAIQRRESDIEAALYQDLHKPQYEAWGLEIGMVQTEIKHSLRHLRRWMKPTTSVAPVIAQPSRSVIYPQPLGPSLILGAWNYPFQLSVQPLVSALAAGCPAVVKPSELSPATSAIIAEILRDTFAPELVSVVEGGVEESTALLKLPWEHIFYTGGTAVGRIVAHAGAEHLSRVTLELGGKSPAIIGPSANMVTTVRRVGWGKWVNAGQTCIAPDYVLVHESVHDAFVEGLREYIRTCYGADPSASVDYCRIVNDRHFRRVAGLIDPAKVAVGGQTDAATRYIAPTVMTGVTWDDPVMKEEIFGPVLPVLKIRSVRDAVEEIRRSPNPLALYLFSEDSADRELIVDRVAFGGGCLNNTAFHLSDPNLPFGGLRTSGAGAYHGKHGFDRFTHYKPFLESSSARLFDLPLRYAPYEGKLSKLKWIFG
jgi:aldehyde dehydrogenase (NAD+)